MKKTSARFSMCAVLCVFSIFLNTALLNAADTLEGLIFGQKWFETDATNFPADNAKLNFKWDVDKANPAKKESAQSKKPGKLFDQAVWSAKVYCDGNRMLGIELNIYQSGQGETALGEAEYKALVEKISDGLQSKLGKEVDAPKRSSSSITYHRWNSEDTAYSLTSWITTQTSNGKVSPYYQLTLSVRPSLESIVFYPKFWEMSGARFAEQNKTMGFKWTSNRKDSARSAWPGIFLGVDIPEALVRLDDDKMTAIALSLYNKGDSGARKYQNDKEFSAFIDQVRQTLEKKLGVKAAERPADAANVARNKGVVWKNKDSNFLLEWNETRENRSRNIPYQAEFLRLVVTPPGGQELAPSQQWKGADHLKTDNNGDKYIFDVPMVDQGQKGYCAVAVAERVLRYYGMEVDQHEVAKMASSSANGTGIDELRAALKNISAKLKLRTRTLVDMDQRLIKDIFDDYNRTAKRKKKDPLNAYEMWPYTLDAEMLKESRIKDKSAIARLERHVVTAIDQGKPLIWAVFIGWAKEPKILPQTRGAHMRLIIGYNAKNKTILFSDSWGAGHEMKEMSLEDAWTMTMGLYVMEL